MAGGWGQVGEMCSRVRHEAGMVWVDTWDEVEVRGGKKRYVGGVRRVGRGGWEEWWMGGARWV